MVSVNVSEPTDDNQIRVNFSDKRKDEDKTNGTLRRKMKIKVEMKKLYELKSL